MRKIWTALVLLLILPAHFAAAADYSFGNEQPTVTESFTTSFNPPKVINVAQELPPGSYGTAGTFHFQTEAFLNGSAYCFIAHGVSRGSGSITIDQYDLSPVATGVHQYTCSFSAVLASSTQYVFGFTGFDNTNAIDGSAATATVNVRTPTGINVAYLDTLCLSQSVSGDFNLCENMHALRTSFAVSSDFAAPRFIASATSSAGVAAYCGITDIGGCITNALAWAFVVPDSVWDEYRSVSLASSSPIGYVYDIQSLFTLYSATTASPALISVDMAPFFGTLASSSSMPVPILSASGLQNTLGADWPLIQNLLSYSLWIGFLFYVYHRSLTLV